MSKSGIAISVKNVKKNFVLPHEKTTSIKNSVLNVFRKKDRTQEMQRTLRGVSFDIKKGEFFGILGRNGSGKSTLLKVLAEIYQPTSGTVGVDGKLVPFIELGVGFNPELTGRENVYLNGALLGFSRKEIDERYDDIVEFAELEKFMDQKLKNYSSGMQVRLAFSVATRAEADILLVDEVLAVGDADFQRKCYDFFKSLKKTGKTVIFVTHDMNAVREYCDKAILINEGVITHSGNANRIADEYMKLFNTNIIQEEMAEKDQDRWGDGRVKIDSVKVRKTDEHIYVTASLVSCTEHKIEGVTVGLRMVNQEGKIVAGVGTARLLGNQSLSFESKEKKILKYKINNFFGAGTYDLAMTLMLGDKITVLDDWNGIERVGNAKSGSFYPVILQASLEIE